MADPEIQTNRILASLSGSGEQRFRRYKAVIEYVAGCEPLVLEEARQALEEKPAFITKLVHELEKGGWLVREQAGSGVFRWNQGKGPFSTEQWLVEKFHGGQVKTAPTQDRPRERLMEYGAESLTVAQLIAILIRSGRPGESAVMAGEKIASQFQNRLHDLPAAGWGELKSISRAVQATAYCQIMAGIELGRRVADLAGQPAKVRISSTRDAMDWCLQWFRRLGLDAKQEEFHIVTLDTKNQVISTHQITVGTLDASLVHPREVFRAAIRDAAQSILLVHNHPSGDPTPSREDQAVTRRLEQCGEMVGIKVLDHIVIGGQTACSLRECSG